jgi:hypothetical protein
MLTLVLEDQPHGPLAHLRGGFVRRLAHDAPSYSGVGASGKPGAVHFCYGKKPYGLGQASLKLLAGDDAMIAGVYCRAALQRNISADLLRSDSLEHLEKLELI